jgi:hypothetical protein
LALVVGFEPKDPWFKPQAAQKTKKKKFFFPKMTHFHYRIFYGLIRKIANSFRKLGLPNFRKSQNCTEIFTVCSVERNPEVFFGASVKRKLLCVTWSNDFSVK